MDSDFSESAEFYRKHFRPFWTENDGEEFLIHPFSASLPEFIETFRKVTGFDLYFVRKNGKAPVGSLGRIPVGTGNNGPSGHLFLTRLANRSPLVDQHSAFLLAESVAQILSDNCRWSLALRRNEAKLAISETKAVLNPSLATSLAERLPHILGQGAKVVRCDAASLFLLNQETTSLKLHAVWGLPQERLLSPPRFLGRAMADLEALLGNAIVLDDPFLSGEWNAPESFTTSICVPVATDSTVLGTAWFFSDKKRNFSDRDLTLLEIVTGRIALELEFATFKERFSPARSKSRKESSEIGNASPSSLPRVPRKRRSPESGGSDASNASPSESEWSSKSAPLSKRSPEDKIKSNQPSPTPSDEQSEESRSRDSSPSDRPVDPSPPSTSVPPAVVASSEIDPSTVEKQVQEILDLLKDHLEKKGTCKNLTLFVVKNPTKRPESS